MQVRHHEPRRGNPAGALGGTRADRLGGGLLSALIAVVWTETVLVDKRYDSDANRDMIRAVGAEPCIPLRKSRVYPIGYTRYLY